MHSANHTIFHILSAALLIFCIAVTASCKKKPQPGTLNDINRTVSVDGQTLTTDGVSSDGDSFAFESAGYRHVC